MNSPVQRLERLIAYRDAFAGNSAVERRARDRAVLEAWAALPRARDRERFRRVAGQPKGI